MVPTLRCGLVRSNFCLAITPPVDLRGARRVDELACDRLRNFLVAIELHRERGPPLRRRAQVSGVAEHGRERDAGADRLRVAARLQALDAAAGLADETALDLLDRLADGLAVGDLGPADVGVDAELAREPVDDDLEMQLAHA